MFEYIVINTYRTNNCNYSFTITIDFFSHYLHQIILPKLIKINAESNRQQRVKRSDLELDDALGYDSDSESGESIPLDYYIGKRSKAKNQWKLYNHPNQKSVIVKKLKSKFGFNRYRNRHSSKKYKKSTSDESNEYEEMKRNNRYLDLNDYEKRSRAFSRFKPKGK